MFSTVKFAKPVVLSVPGNTSVKVGSNVTLKCEVQSLGFSPIIMWLKWINGVPKSYPKLNLKVDTRLNGAIISGAGAFVANFPHEEFVIVDLVTYNQVLNIVNVTEKDFGVYTCIAVNDLGHDYGSTILKKRK